MMRFAADCHAEVIQVVVDASGFSDVMGAISAMHSTSTGGIAEVVPMEKDAMIEATSATSGALQA